MKDYLKFLNLEFDTTSNQILELSLIVLSIPTITALSQGMRIYDYIRILIKGHNFGELKLGLTKDI